MGKPTLPKKFPLYCHANGSFAKRINGKIRFFGPWGKGKGKREQLRLRRSAEQRYHAEIDSLRAGVADDDPAELTLKQLTDKYRALKFDGISKRRQREFIWLIDSLTALLGADRLVSSLRPDHFAEFRKELEGRSPSPETLAVRIKCVRTIFNVGWQNMWFDSQVRFGEGFKLPSQDERNRHRHAVKRENGDRDFTPEEIARQLEHAGSRRMTFCILMALNCAFGVRDLCVLTWADIRDGWYSSLRNKSALPRRAKLWKRTLDALDDYVENERLPPARDFHDYVLTNERARCCTTETLGRQITRMLKRAGCHRVGVSSYGWRRTAITAAYHSGDELAAKLMAGHAMNDQTSQYVQAFPDERLEHVAMVVERQIFGQSGGQVT